MKPRKKQKKLRITEADFMLANRRAARLEEIAEHGRPVSMRSALHKSKKVYDRKRFKKAGINPDDLSFRKLTPPLCVCEGVYDGLVVFAYSVFLEGIVGRIGYDDVVEKGQVESCAALFQRFG